VHFYLASGIWQLFQSAEREQQSTLPGKEANFTLITVSEKLKQIVNITKVESKS